jgi:hypothetical protein
MVPLPPIADGNEIVVHSETNTAIEQVPHRSWSCPAGHGEGDPACTYHDYTQAEPVTRTKTAALYGDQPITYAQFKVMTDARRADKLGELDELSHKCTRANVPRYAGLVAMLGGLIGGTIVYAAHGPGDVVMYGGLGVGAAAYALGYFAFGGRDCVRAQNLYNELDVSRAMTWNTVEGADYASEMKTLADQFNAAHGRRATSLNMR